MRRLQFIRSAGYSLIYIPIHQSWIGNSLQKSNSKSDEKKHSKFFPDKENYLTEATCVFATPGWGDGKNGDDSFVDVIVDVECYDMLYTGRGAFINNTEIEVNQVRDMGIAFPPKDIKAIFYDGIKNISVTILGNKPNQSGGSNDKWNVRWEFYLKFKKGNVLSTGGSDPATEYHFAVEQNQINFPTDIPGRKAFFTRKELFDHRTLNPGTPIG